MRTFFFFLLWRPNFLCWPNFLVELAEKTWRDRATLNPSLQCLCLCLRARYIDNTVRLVSARSDVQFPVFTKIVSVFAIS